MSTALAALPYAIDVRTMRKVLGLSECSSCSGLAEVGDTDAMRTFWQIASVVSAAASGYHGYKRNDSIGWAVAWFMLGGLMPVLVPVVAIAQGYAEPAR